MERSLYERQNKLSSLEQMLADEREQAAHQINNKNREIQQNKDQDIRLTHQNLNSSFISLNYFSVTLLTTLKLIH